MRLATSVMVLLLASACGDDEATGSGGASGSGGATTDATGSTGSAGSGGGGGEAVDWAAAPLRDQVAAMEIGELASEALTTHYLARIAAEDPQPEGIGAVIATIDDAEAEAATLDAARGGGALLQGAVILLKDNIDQEGLPTTAGSIALANNVAAEDADLTARIRGAGALLLGKTNLSEWANFRGNRSTSGWSSAGGQTRNGFDPDYNPCGSSSGSAAAVAADFASAAIGTETDGSITCPAAVNGLVGFKPTVGLVSRHGIVPISHTQDTAGPITRTVGDAARLLRVMAGVDERDVATLLIPDDLDLDFEAALPSATLGGKRLGVVTTLTGYDTALDAVFNAEIARMEAAGATLVPVELPSYGAFGADEYTVLLHDFKVDLAAYLESHPQPGQALTLAELIAFNQDNADVVMPYFGQEVFEAAEETTGLDAPEYLAAKENAARTTGEEGIDAVMAANELDALLAPTTGPAWVTNYATGDAFGGSASSHAAVAGYPHLTVPMGLVDGLPVGMSVFAGAWQDREVLALGHAYEQLPR